MYIKVKATPGAKQERFEMLSADTFKISVKEPAERNLANARIIELIAAHFKIVPKKARMISGHHQPSKILDIAVNQP